MGAIVSNQPLYNKKFQLLILGVGGDPIYDSQSQLKNPSNSSQVSTVNGVTTLKANISTELALDVSDLRCVFRVEKHYVQQWQFSEVTIYNLSPETETNIFENGTQVILSAGYEHGPYGQIYAGNIYQPIRGKEDGVTYFLTLRCLDGDRELNLNLCNFSIGSGYTKKQMAEAVCRSSKIPFKINVDDNLDSQKIQRGKAFFGAPSDYIRSIAQNSGASFFMNNGQAYLKKLNDKPPAVVPGLNSATGLIGIPHQTEQGVQFRSLINPNLDIDGWVQLNNKDIVQADLQPFMLQTVLDRDGLYHIIGLIISGDTRGNDWYTDCECIGQLGFTPNLLADRNQSGM